MATFTEAGEAIIAALGTALETAAAAIMAEADYLIPKDTETARESARLFPVEDRGDALMVRFGYGFGGAINPKTGHAVEEYIVPLHEILEHHHDPPTQAKFLEEPLFAAAAGLEQALGTEVETELRLGYGKSLR